MITTLPLEPGIPHFDFSTAIESVEYGFAFRWNDREPAPGFYMDIFEADGTPILRSVKVVLGVFLGRRSTHKLFSAGGFVAVDTSGDQREATLDDFGTRVEIRYYSTSALLGEVYGD